MIAENKFSGWNFKKSMHSNLEFLLFHFLEALINSSGLISKAVNFIDRLLLPTFFKASIKAPSPTLGSNIDIRDLLLKYERTLFEMKSAK